MNGDQPNIYDKFEDGDLPWTSPYGQKEVFTSSGSTSCANIDTKESSSKDDSMTTNNTDLFTAQHIFESWFPSDIFQTNKVETSGQTPLSLEEVWFPDNYDLK